MHEAFRVEVKVPVRLESQDGIILASCEPLGVYTQGATEEEVRANMREALELFFEGCVEMGTLVDVLGDAELEVREGRVDYEDGPEEFRVPISLVAARRRNGGNTKG